jgi:uncharacterized coiled-coil protein SlyX
MEQRQADQIKTIATLKTRLADPEAAADHQIESLHLVVLLDNVFSRRR